MEGQKTSPSQSVKNGAQNHLVQHPEDNRDEVERVKQRHNEAYLYVEQALNLDEKGHADQAIVLYQKSIACIDTACSIPDQSARCRGQEWQKARNLIQKMQRSRQQIQSRLNSLIQSHRKPSQVESESPPSYEEATGSAASNVDMALDDILCDDEKERVDLVMSAAMELFRIDDGVQVFFIKKDGYVSAPSYPSSLGVYKFVDGVNMEDGATAGVELSQVFLKIGDWTYPLLEGQSPVLHANWGAYIFPDVMSSAAEWLSWGIVKGATKTGELVKKGSVKLQQNITPEINAVKVDPTAQKGLYYTRKATEGVVMVSSFLVNKLGKATMYLAQKAAPQIRQHGEKYLPQCVIRKDSGGQSKLDGALEVAGGGIKGWVTVYMGLEQAAKTLAKNIADETVHVVKHKYGEELGNITEDTLYSGGNIAMTIHYTSNIGAKAIAKRVAKDTGQVLVVDAPVRKQTRPDPGDNQNGTMDCNDKSTELRDS
ncbi:hypothetical protein LSH36_14g02027 [Paralvinella palmiformis]|uniref:MIT domain-containing protein n=1 Tax=Paralvinella palmiformis TaxID=53620 RepID=A0AAD9NFW2_9ANNE|nr:hypothetical protein LSH36_14g02027 [Paralvinella palmiformis]